MKDCLCILLSTILMTSCAFNATPEKSDVDKELCGKDSSKIAIGEERMSSLSYIKEHFDPDHIGFIVYDIDSSEVLFSHNRKRPFIPASCLKVPTIITAFDTLGPDYRFTTTVAADGPPRGGIIQGNLYLHGNGDPSLEVSDLIDIINRLKNRGIRGISGEFHYDRSSLPRRQILDETMDLDESYNTGVSSLSVDYNCIDARWFNNSDKTKPDIILTPNLPMFAAQASAKKKNEIPETVTFEHSWKNYQSLWELSPDANSRGHERLPVRRPAMYTAQLFTYIARINGIELPWPSHGLMPRRADVLVKHKGKTVSEIAETTMRYSVNLYAELLFLASAKELMGEKTTYSESGRMMELYAREKFPNIDWKGYTIVNGSGLSSKNRISPEQMLAFLIYAHSREFGERSFPYYLQPSGWNYSLRNRFYRSYGAFRVYGKTGTINYAVGLTGSIHTQSGKHLLFVFFNSNEYLRYLHEQNPKRYGDDAVNQANRWIYAYRSAMDRIIDEWIVSL